MLRSESNSAQQEEYCHNMSIALKCHKRSTISSEKLKRRNIESGTVEMSILARASKSEAIFMNKLYII